jgi:hypothetical protein
MAVTTAITRKSVRQQSSCCEYVVVLLGFLFLSETSLKQNKVTVLQSVIRAKVLVKKMVNATLKLIPAETKATPIPPPLQKKKKRKQKFSSFPNNNNKKKRKKEKLLTKDWWKC